MRDSIKAFLFEEGGKLLSDAIRIMMTRPSKRAPAEVAEKEVAAGFTKVAPQSLPSLAETPEPEIGTTKVADEGLSYRYECICKHLGAASVLLREAYERALNEGIGEGTAEKIMEALNEHAGMEADLEKMLTIPEARGQVEKLMSGVKAFRNAAWKAKLPTGGGTKEDIQDARLWNDILFTEAYNSAKAQPGTVCIEEEGGK